jgi:hypothetical protein
MARKALDAAYVKAASKDPAGELWTRYDLAQKRFHRAADDMKERLGKWIDERIRGNNPAKQSLKALFQEKAQVEARFASRLGAREDKRDKAVATARQWQKAYADWSKPADVISAQIGEYFDKIDKLNADVNTDKNADLAIYTFWFEVAPKHLQLSRVKVNETIAPGVQTLKDALTAAFGEHHGYETAWESGKDRGDGSLFLLATAGAEPLTAHRKKVLDCWSKAATEQAKREAAYKLRPDDAATLKSRRDALIQGRAAAVKALLEDPAP